MLWADTHGDTQTLESLGYRPNPDGSIGFEGDNALFSGSHRNVAWTPAFTY